MALSSEKAIMSGLALPCTSKQVEQLDDPL